MSPLLTAQCADGDATEALAGHRPGAGWLFSAPRGGVVASGPARRVPGPTHVARALADARAEGHPDPVAIGALPFRGSGADALAVPRTVRRLRAGTVVAGAARTPARVWDSVPHVAPQPDPAAYRDAVAAAIEQLRAGGLDKVVLARALRVTGHGRPDSAALLANLAAADPGAHVYSMPLGGGSALVGASPELLISRSGGRVVAHPMAGSAPRSGDAATDRERARGLLASGKDLREHAAVVEAVRAGLGPLCARLDVPDAPEISTTPTMIHLATRIEGTLADPAVTALDAALALHPTPAVCGVPAGAARGVIGELEPFNRGPYAGLTGWTDAHGDGEWAVTIRCGIVESDADSPSVRLYAGAGIMADSDPDAELAETGAKFGTLLRALGAEDAGR